MRLFIVCALLLVVSVAPAQSRWTMSAGPEWTRGDISTMRTWGVRVRAEYDLTKPNSAFGLRLESGARWSPTQGYYWNYGFGSVGGVEQKVDLMLGLNAYLSPLPDAGVSPYFTIGVFGRQQWIHGSRWSRDSSSFSSSPTHTETTGKFIGALGVGLRSRLFGHSFQLELRRLYDHNGITFGTRIPF